MNLYRILIMVRRSIGVPLLLLSQLTLWLLCSCSTDATANFAAESHRSYKISVIADAVWTFSQSHPDGFTLDVRNMTEPRAGIAVSYAATQDSHSRDQLDRVVAHALQHDGYVGGWYNQENGLYYFDSSRLFPEDCLEAAIEFGRENGQHSVYSLSSSVDIPIQVEPSAVVYQ